MYNIECISEMEAELCCGCGVCENVCGVKAITMICDGEGFTYPRLDISKCVSCGKCTEKCPVLTYKRLKSTVTYNKKAYAGYYKDIDKLRSSASGGAASAISEKFIEEGGIVFGVAYSDDFYHARHQSIISVKDIFKLKGSKYVQSEKSNIYPRIREYLNKNIKVLFIGTPCEVGAVKAYLGKEYENLYTCELICHGVTSSKVMEQYMKKIEKVYKSKIQMFTVRYKKEGWTPPYIRAKFQNGDEHLEPFYTSDYGYAFSMMSRPSCYSCVYKGENKVADITLGDFWGIDEKSDDWNSYGVSAIVVQSLKGEKLLLNLPDFYLNKTSYKKILKGNYLMEESRECSSRRDKFSKLLKKRGLVYACRETRSLKERVKLILFKS